ncbi:MAG: response regulator [Lachnospiraceae bacterium]|nr:response regulator [Lachnospiraceae bacterium]
MNRNILFIAKAETFIVKGLEAKLAGLKTNPVYAQPKIQEIEEKSADTDLIILYLDDTIDKSSQTLVYIKDLCAAKDIRVLVIGGAEEYEVVQNWIPSGFVTAFCERPLDIEKLLDAVERYFTSATEMERKKSILIVDDDVQYMSMIMDWLKDTYRISVANSGMQAITWLATNHADLILLDYEMPITPGPQVLQMIKSEPKTADIPVIFLTGKGDKESIMQVLALKPAGYLLKTIDRAGLHDTLKKHFAAQLANAR